MTEDTTPKTQKEDMMELVKDVEAKKENMLHMMTVFLSTLDKISADFRKMFILETILLAGLGSLKADDIDVIPQA